MVDASYSYPIYRLVGGESPRGFRGQVCLSQAAMAACSKWRYYTISNSALNDMEEVLTWCAEQWVPEVGARLVEEVLQRIHALAEQLDMGRVVTEFGQSFLR